MFSFLFKNRLKVLLKQKTMIFWTILFPIALGTFFNLAFSNLAQDEIFEPIPVAVVKNNDSSFQNMITIMSEEQYLTPTTVETEEEAKKLLKDKEVDGYYLVSDTIKLVVQTNGLNQTILKQIVDQYRETATVVNAVTTLHPEAIKEGILETLNEEHVYLQDQSTKNIDVTVIYFYTLIGMACLYAGFFGVNAVNEVEANQSKKAARLSISPTHKLTSLLASLLAGFLIQYTGILLLLVYLTGILHIDFGNQMIPILILTFFGSIAGITFGMCLGSCTKKSENTKTAILLATTLTCSFLSGMMMVDMKYIIAEHVPLLGYINPVAMITDALYALYYYPTYDRYLFNIVSLLLFSIVMVTISYCFLRRKKYDSI